MEPEEPSVLETMTPGAEWRISSSRGKDNDKCGKDWDSPCRRLGFIVTLPELQQIAETTGLPPGQFLAITFEAGTYYHSGTTV